MIAFTTTEEVNATLEKLFKTPGAGHNFKLGVLALAYELEQDEKVREEILIGMVHIQAMVVSYAVNETSTLSKGLRDILGVSDEAIEEAGKKVDELHAKLKEASDAQNNGGFTNG